jgi:hypothetical protein
MLALGVVLSGCSQAPAPEAKPRAGAKPQAEVKPEAGAKPQAEVKPEAGAKPQAEVKPEAGAKPQAEVKPEAEAKPEAETKPQPKPGPQPGSSASVADVKVSAFAPAEDLASQVPVYIKDLEEAVKEEKEYGYYAEQISKDSNTLILIALALGLHDQDNQYKAAAGGLMKAAQELAATKDFASAQKAVAAVKKAAATPSSAAGELKWEKVATLQPVMKKVQPIKTRLIGSLRRMERRAKDAQGQTAVLAVIAQGSMANAAETTKPDEVQKWHECCLAMREAAVAVNAAVRAKDKEAVTATMKQLQKTCDDCHVVFFPDALEKAKEDGEVTE